MTNRIKELREGRGFSQERLAELAHTTRSQIVKLERGERRLTVDWMRRLAPALDCVPADLLPTADTRSAVPGSEAARAATPEPDDRADLLAVRSGARGGIDQEMFLTDGPIDYVSRPAYLRNVRAAYALYVIGESMDPRYRHGQLIHVNPSRPIGPGDGVAVTKKNSVVLVKEFVRRSPQGLVLREYRPEDRQFEVPFEDVADVHRIVAAVDP